MGFEQLAALRDQLAAQAAQERKAKHEQEDGAKRGPKAPDGEKPGKTGGRAHGKPGGKPGGKPARDGQARPPQPRGASAPGGARSPKAAPQAPEAPRDPVLVAIGRLQHSFPKAFPKRPAPRVPLKLGIVEDLNAQAVRLRLTEADIKAAVSTWCGVARYWAALKKDAPRIDLNGEPNGAVTAAEAAHASFLARRQRKQKEQAEKEQAGKEPAEQAQAAAAQAPAETPVQAPAPQDASSAQEAAPEQDALPVQDVQPAQSE
jgi:ProP effector